MSKNQEKSQAISGVPYAKDDYGKQGTDSAVYPVEGCSISMCVSMDSWKTNIRGLRVGNLIYS